MTLTATADMITEQTALEAIEAALSEARAAGADSCEASVAAGSGLSVTVRSGELETLEHNRDKSLSLTVYRDGCTGSTSTADFSPGAIGEIARSACSIAAHTSADRCAGLADAADLATEIPDLDLAHPWDLEPAAAEDIALICESAARETDQRISNSDGATVSRHDNLFAYGNSLGFRGSYGGSRHSISCVVIAGSGDAMQRDYWYSVSRVPGELEDPAAIGRRAAERTVARLDARQVPTADVPVLFEARLASGLFGHLASAISGGALYRKASFLLDAAGEQIFPDWLNIDEDPHLPRAMASSPFDLDGVATRPRRLVDAGTLTGYVLSAYAARRLGLKTTGNAGGIHNLIVQPGEDSLETLIGGLDRGLLVTELMGFGVNTVTGDYSRGAAGFWIENGALAYPVEEITIAGNLRDMFRGVLAVGSDVDRRGAIHTGSVLIDRMTVAGS